MKRITNLEDNYRVETYGLSEEQHNMVVEMVNDDEPYQGSYSIKEATTEMANIWLDNANSEEDEEYAEFLQDALISNADLFVLVGHLGDASQKIGDIAVYNYKKC